MVEARVECLCPEFDLADIRLRLRRGDVAWVSEGVARGSVDLGIAIRSGAVSVVYVRRCSVSRSPPPPNVRMNRVQRGGVVNRTPSPSPEPGPVPRPEPPVVDTGSIEEAIARGVTRAIEGLIRSGALVPGGTRGPVQAVGAPSVPVTSSDAPLYIPSNIVPTGDAPTITVARSSSEGATLDEAAAALKATRKRKSTT